MSFKDVLLLAWLLVSLGHGISLYGLYFGFYEAKW